MELDGDFDSLGDLSWREDKCLVQNDDPREVMPMRSKLLNKIISYNNPNPNYNVTNFLHEAHPSRCMFKLEMQRHDATILS